MSQFILLPWEHPFSGLNPRPAATARLSVGGKTRNFLLKIHDNTLYFKEPARAAIFAIFDTFDAKLPNDPIGLISRWQHHIANNNFGVLVQKRDYFPKLPVRAQILMLIKPDGTGWMKEHFDTEWFLLPDEGRADLNLWNDKEVETHARLRLPIVQRQLINRAIPPQVLESDPPRWLAESGDKITELLGAATRLFVIPSAYWNDPEIRVLKLKSNSTFAKGDIEGQWLKHALYNEKFQLFWNVLEPHIQFMGVRWTEGGEKLEHYARPRNESIFQAGIEKWGSLWRGNWAPQRASFKIDLPDPTNQTAHEQMEATLLLRHWLKEKLPPEKIEQLL